MRKWLLTLFVLSCFIFPIILIPPGTAQDEAVGAKSDQHPAEKNEKQETESALYKFLDKLSLWNRQLNQPVWYVMIFLGALLTISFTNSKLIWGVIHYLFTWEKSAIEGDWHAYHFTYMEGEPIIIKSNVRIKKGIGAPLRAELYENVESELHYKGKILHEQGQLIFYYESTDHKEIVINRFIEPIGKHCKVLYGCWLSFDHDKNIACGGIILSQKAIKNNVESKLLRGFDLQINKPLLRIKPK